MSDCGHCWSSEAKREQAQAEAGEQAQLAAHEEAEELTVHMLEEPAIEEILGPAPGVPPSAVAQDTAAVSERPYAQNHAWEASRYARVFPILMVLISQWRWLHCLLGRG